MDLGDTEAPSAVENPKVSSQHKNNEDRESAPSGFKSGRPRGGRGRGGAIRGRGGRTGTMAASNAAARQALGALASVPVIAQLLQEAPNMGLREVLILKDLVQDVPAAKTNFRMLKDMMKQRLQQQKIGNAGSPRSSHSFADEPSSTHKIKADPSTASAPDDSASVTSFNTADDSSRKPGRQRRNTLRSTDADESRTETKRHPNDTVDSTPTSKSHPTQASLSPAFTPRRVQPTRPGYVLATRNFPRITQPLLNEVTSHRLASLFAKPISERDAPGYKDVIRRPQNLKSIRTAVNAGGRALVAALDEMGDDAGPGAHVWVPESEDLVPPKGIVNAAQLEKELMRMFANAVMFNPDVVENRGLGPAFRTRRKLREGDGAEAGKDGEGGRFELGVAPPMEGAVIQDTRDIAKDVQESYAAWRAVERAGTSDTPAGVVTPMKLRGGGDGADDEEAEDSDRDEDEDKDKDDDGDDNSEEDVQESVEGADERGRRNKRRRR